MIATTSRRSACRCATTTRASAHRNGRPARFQSPLPPQGGRCHGVTEGGSAGDEQLASRRPGQQGELRDVTCLAPECPVQDPRIAEKGHNPLQGDLMSRMSPRTQLEIGTFNQVRDTAHWIAGRWLDLFQRCLNLLGCQHEIFLYGFHSLRENMPVQVCRDDSYASYPQAQPNLWKIRSIRISW